MTDNQRILLRARPTGFRNPKLLADSVPVRAPAADEVLLETICPVDRPGDAVLDERGPYQPRALGAVMRSGGIARVLESRADAFQPGELVQARLGWQTHPTLAGEIPAEGRSRARRCAGLDRSARSQRGDRATSACATSAP